MHISSILYLFYHIFQPLQSNNEKGIIKQNLLKRRLPLPRVKIKNCIICVAGGLILAFGLYNVHSLSKVKVTRIIRTCLKTGIFGAFHLFLFDRRQPICIKDRAKIPRKFLALRSKILKRADFCSIKAKTQPILSYWRVF